MNRTLNARPFVVVTSAWAEIQPVRFVSNSAGADARLIGLLCSQNIGELPLIKMLIRTALIVA